MDTSISPFHQARLSYEPRFPSELADWDSLIVASSSPAVSKASDNAERLRRLFPMTWGQPAVRLAPKTREPGRAIERRPYTVAVVLSGGPAPGGHNVLWGLV